MEYSLEVTGAVKIDIFEALDWYEEQQPGLGATFFAAFITLSTFLMHG